MISNLVCPLPRRKSRLRGIGKSRFFRVESPGNSLMEMGPSVWEVTPDFFCRHCDEGCGCKTCRWTGQSERHVFPCRCPKCGRDFEVEADGLFGDRMTWVRDDGGVIRFLQDCPEHRSPKHEKDVRRRREVVYLC